MLVRGAVWCVMVGAMMLPSAVPLLRLFAEVSGRQARPRRLLACFAAGYLAVWALFGWAALAVDDGVHRVAHALPWLAAHPWLVGAAILGLAGAFQFSSLEDRCLTACRHPAAYPLRHYRRGPAAAYRLGWGHGLSCLGCCWALTLVMFAAGVADCAGWRRRPRHGQRLGLPSWGLPCQRLPAPQRVPLRRRGAPRQLNVRTTWRAGLSRGRRPRRRGPGPAPAEHREPHPRTLSATVVSCDWRPGT
jgi:hypothetical protein